MFRAAAEVHMSRCASGSTCLKDETHVGWKALFEALESYKQTL